MRSDNNKKFWDQFAGIYGAVMERSSKQLYEDICKKIALQLDQQMNVLELACGSGQLSFRLAPKVRLWEATDFSDKMIAEAKKKAGTSRLHFSVQDATDLPYGDDSFDAVVISNALHIMPNPGQVLKEIYRVLKADGTMYAPTFIQWKGAAFRLRSALFRLAGFKVYTKWSEAGFEAYIRENGFAVIESARLGKNMYPLCYLAARVAKTENLHLD